MDTFWINLKRRLMDAKANMELEQIHVKQKAMRQGWINLYRGHPSNPPQAHGFAHPTERVARSLAHLHGDDCIATVKVEWDE